MCFSRTTDWSYYEDAKHDDDYKVVGVLKNTNSPSDRVIWIPLDGIYRMKGHVLRGSGENYEAKADEEIPDESKEVSAVMLKFNSPQAGMSLEQTVNRQGKVATLAFPIGPDDGRIVQQDRLDESCPRVDRVSGRYCCGLFDTREHL